MSEELRVKWKYWITSRGGAHTAHAPTSCPEKAADYIYRITGEKPIWMMDGAGNEWDMTRNAFGQEIQPA